MAILVYKVVCTASGKAYVGITARALDTRWFEHVSRAREGGRDSRLHDAIRKYGVDAFTREVIATADTEDEARSLERHFIKALGTWDNGYNCNEGGCGWLKIPESVKRKIGDAQRDKVIPEESRMKMSAAKKGKSECAGNFGEHTRKGAANPRAHAFLIRFPDGSEREVVGLRAFARENYLKVSHLKDRRQTKGYSIVRRLGPSTSPDIDATPKVQEK